jgi:hypothetical protein
MLKTLLVITISLFSQFAFSMDHPSVHGMAMVGTHKIYLSHLPMFHSPHDYQAILEVSLSAEGQEKYLQSKASSSETLYTLVPESFVLPEMIANPKPLKASLFKGHFERDGVEIVSDITVTITKVLYFMKFSPQAKQPLDANYLIFGNAQEQFAAHTITAKPDFDQLLSISTSPELTAELEKKSIVQKTFAGKKNQEPLQAPEVLNNEIEVKQNLYLEFGDLSH